MTEFALNDAEALAGEALLLTRRLTQDLYPEFADRVAAESFQALITTELSRWRDCRIRDFVPIFVGRRVRARLRAPDGDAVRFVEADVEARERELQQTGIPSRL